MCPPDSHDVLLRWPTLYTRFIGTHSNDDYEEATALLERILDPNQPGECPDSIRDQASSLATELALVRSTIFENPQYSEVTISRLRTLLSSPSVDETLRLQFTDHLGDEVRERFRHYSLPRALKKRTPILHNLLTFHPLKAWKESGELFLDRCSGVILDDEDRGENSAS
jgi:hypothetical protein